MLSLSINHTAIIGEFSGMGSPIKEHLWNPEMRNWGFQTYHSEKELLDAYIYIFTQVVEMKKNKVLSLQFIHRRLRGGRIEWINDARP